jgi:hypothetical protein
MALYFVYVLIPAKTSPPPPKTHIPIQVEYIHEDKYIDAALAYCDSLGYNTEFAILIDMAPHSGNYRFFGYNLETKDTIVKGLVAHGHCQSVENRYAEFSNEIGSNCSSLGHFLVGRKYEGSFGTSYKLYGQDKSNSNALNRFVVLHSHSCIPDVERQDDICLSEGCPTISPTVLQKIIPILDSSKKPVLLWIYKSSKKQDTERVSSDDLQRKFELEYQLR